MTVTRKQVVEAMQDAWNDFCTDSGDHPDCFDVYNHRGTLIDGHTMHADFERGNFATSVTDILNALLEGRR